jgi:hypothetical protein
MADSREAAGCACLGYKSPGSSIFFSEQTSHQPVVIFFQKQISTDHQPPAK